MARVVAWLLLLAGLVGVLFMRVVHEKLLGGHVPFIVVFLATMALPAVGLVLFQDLGKLRQAVPAAVRMHLRLHRSLIVAIGLLLTIFVLWIFGATLNEPALESFGLVRPAAGTIGGTEPPYFEPGETIQLTVDEGDESILGLWQCANPKVEPLTSPALWAQTEWSVWTEEETWDQSKDYLTGGGVPSTFSAENVPFAPWVRFTVPADPNLQGTTQKLHVHMYVLYPEFRGSQQYLTQSRQVDREVAFAVPSITEATAYRQWQTACGRNRQRNGLRQVTMIACAIALLVVLVNAGNKPAPAPVAKPAETAP